MFSLHSCLHNRPNDKQRVLRHKHAFLVALRNVLLSTSGIVGHTKVGRMETFFQCEIGLSQAFILKLGQHMLTHIHISAWEWINVIWNRTSLTAPVETPQTKGAAWLVLHWRHTYSKGCKHTRLNHVTTMNYWLLFHCLQEVTAHRWRSLWKQDTSGLARLVASSYLIPSQPRRSLRTKCNS